MSSSLTIDFISIDLLTLISSLSFPLSDGPYELGVPGRRGKDDGRLVNATILCRRVEPVVPVFSSSFLDELLLYVDSFGIILIKSGLRAGTEAQMMATFISSPDHIVMSTPYTKNPSTNIPQRRGRL